MKIIIITIAFLLILGFVNGEQQAIPNQQEEFEQELLHTFNDYDTNKDGSLTQEEMFVILEEDLPNKQAITDALDMLKSLFELYDLDENGLQWQEFKEMALIRKTAFTDVEEQDEPLDIDNQIDL